MRKTTFTFILLLSMCVNAFTQDSLTQDSIRKSNLPAITFKAEILDYGSITKETYTVRQFEFTNTGRKPLTINHCKAKCTCVVLKWSKESIMPGEKGFITVRYDVKHTGRFSETITVFSNAVTMTKIIKIKGEVLL